MGTTELLIQRAAASSSRAEGPILTNSTLYFFFFGFFFLAAPLVEGPAAVGVIPGMGVVRSNSGFGSSDIGSETSF